MLAKRYNVVQMRQFFSSKSCVRLLSLPMRGEWIEISIIWLFFLFCARLSPCGESGLKWALTVSEDDDVYVSPHAGRVD